jgi:Bacterial SH3 domain
MRSKWWWLLAVAMLSAPAAAQEAGTVLKEDTLRAEPYADAKILASLRKGAPVTILKRTSGWYQVKAQATTGWVRMLSVRRGAASQGNVAKDVSGVGAISTGRAGTGQVVSTTGVRGLSEAELKNARFDEAQIKKAESFAVSAQAAQTFAAQGKLTVHKFDYLPVPQQSAQAQGGPR